MKEGLLQEVTMAAHKEDILGARPRNTVGECLGV